MKGVTKATDKKKSNALPSSSAAPRFASLAGSEGGSRSSSISNISSISSISSSSTAIDDRARHRGGGGELSRPAAFVSSFDDALDPNPVPLPPLLRSGSSSRGSPRRKQQQLQKQQQQQQR